MLNQYYERINESCSRTRCNDACEARTTTTESLRSLPRVDENEAHDI